MAATLKRRVVEKPYKCSICQKLFPSPEAGSAHLEKKHSGGGYIFWCKSRNAALSNPAKA